MAMRRKGIFHPEYLHILDSSGHIFHGCDQDWFNTYWQRRSGCGPTVASNLILYLNRSGRLPLPYEVMGKEGSVALMDDMWDYVTPTRRGINTVALFAEGMQAFSARYGLDMECASLTFAKEKEDRPSYREVADFLSEGLELDCPIAFLNLSNGIVDALDAWHWVTLVEMWEDLDGGKVFVTFYDGQTAATINLCSWCETTTEAGGFVHFQKVTRSEP